MQHSFVVMGLVPMTPETWLELEHTTHGCHAQTCRSSRISSGCTVLPFFCIGLDLEFGCHSPFLRFRGWVGWGTNFFTDLRRTLPFAANDAQGSALETLWGRMRVQGGGDSGLYCFRSCVDSPSCIGAAFWCWLGTWLHTAFLCCYGPCLNDPRDVA